MKVLMQSRSNLFSCRGGDTIQILKTKEYLEKMGVQVDVSTNIYEDLSDYDIVHLFNLTRVQETYLQAQNAKNQNKPIILSTIYWSTDEFELKGDLGFRKVISRLFGINKTEKLKMIFKYLKGEDSIPIKKIINKKYFDIQKEIIEMSDWFLPNSTLEISEIESKLNCKIDNFNVVVNAVDVNETYNDKTNDEFDDCILCVGRIEPRKNQLKLVNALYNTEYKLIIVGSPAPNHYRYYKKVKKCANKNTIFMDYIPNDQIYNIYSISKVHVLPSWFETPGLVSLEAGACGCNLVITDRGTTKDYFKDMAYYCEPDDEISILNAVNDAYHSDKNNDLKKYILDNYTWEKASLQTLEGYNKLWKKVKNEECFYNRV